MPKSITSKGELLLSGNEAIALGAHESGVSVASAYPGTPSTEILQNLINYKGVYVEWAPNEKVALEVAVGASLSGVRALATMKHVGLNIAADPLFTAAYVGVRGGLLIVTADDPGMHSSQNEQDNRNYALSAKVPMLEPADAAEAKEFTRLGYRISEKFDIPVLLRTTTRVSHVKGVVAPKRRSLGKVKPGIVKMPQKMVMLPGNARARRVDLERRLEGLKAFAETFEHNRIERGSDKLGIITSGISYLYVKEAFPDASVLKLGMVHPFPDKMIKKFAASVSEVLIVEELDPFIETHVRAMGIDCRGKDVIPAIGELNQTILRHSVGAEPEGTLFKPEDIPVRPPSMCPGCPHRGVFYALSKEDVFVSGDIGCYTLGAMKPLSAMDTCICMGASIGVAHGIDKALGTKALGKTVAVLGDSTFIHSGITGLINVVYNKGVSTVIILDNRTTAMTGHQPTPASGKTITGQDAPALDFEALVRAIGVQHVYTLNPHDLSAAREVISREVNRPAPSVIITTSPCVLLPEERRRPKTRYIVETAQCTGCRVCLSIGCPAMQWVDVSATEAKKLGLKKKKQRGYVSISPALCVGCSQCAQLCKFDAIKREDE